MSIPPEQDPIIALYPEEDDVAQTWIAKYHSQCVNCPTKIYPGDEVVWIGDPEDRAIAHALCPDPEVTDLSAPNGVCPDCHQALPVSKVCGWC